MNQSDSKSFSEDSARQSLSDPRKRLASSMEAGWTSLLVRKVRTRPSLDYFETEPTCDQTLTMTLTGQRAIQHNDSGYWNKSIFHRGVGSLLAPNSSMKLRWSSLTPEPIQTVHINIPRAFFEEAAEEHRPAGTATRLHMPTIQGFSDSVVFSVVHGLLNGMRLGLPNLYAETAASFLATHLLFTQKSFCTAEDIRRIGDELTDLRLRRTLDYMEAHFAESLSIRRLAAEAAISPFHFARLFKLKTGQTPHQYLVHLRLQHSQRLLRGTDLSITQVANNCGFAHVGYFAALFKRSFGDLPSAYRSDSAQA